MAPIMTFAFRAHKLYMVTFPIQFQRYEKIDVTIFTMIHMYDRSSSPLHPSYKTIAS